MGTKFSYRDITLSTLFARFFACAKLDNLSKHLWRLYRRIFDRQTGYDCPSTMEKGPDMRANGHSQKQINEPIMSVGAINGTVDPRNSEVASKRSIGLRLGEGQGSTWSEWSVDKDLAWRSGTYATSPVNRCTIGTQLDTGSCQCDRISQATSKRSRPRACVELCSVPVANRHSSFYVGQFRLSASQSSIDVAVASTSCHFQHGFQYNANGVPKKPCHFSLQKMQASKAAGLYFESQHPSISVKLV